MKHLAFIGVGKMTLREDANYIIKASIEAVLPDEAVTRALQSKPFNKGKVYLVAVGKAAWQMAKAASDLLGNKIEKGVCISKYGHIKGDIPRIVCFEAGHPVPDANSFKGTQAAIELVSDLTTEDTVLFLVSGGGSALFEKPLVSGEVLADLTKQLLACGADIIEINTLRKRISEVKGGKFAEICKPAQVFSVVLSDILGDPLDMIASGPAYPDGSTCEKAKEIIEKYHLKVSEEVMKLMEVETPKQLDHVETVITGSVKQLCKAARKACQELGYKPILLTDALNCEAREAGSFLAAIAKTYQESKESLAFIVGGETVVHLTGQGMGGRNQEIALSAAVGISGLKDTALFSIGSDGTDGPTDAAGGYVDQDTEANLERQGVKIFEMLQNNDAYHALEKVDGLIITGATGTNVNDVTVLLIRR